MATRKYRKVGKAPSERLEDITVRRSLNRKTFITTKEETKGRERIRRERVREKIGKREIEAITNRLTRRKDESWLIVDSLPDIAKAIEILVSSIINPKNFVSRNVSIRMRDIDLDEKLKVSILELAKEHINKGLDIENRIEPMIRQALCIEGAYVLGYIPPRIIEKVVDNYRKLLLDKDRLNSYAIESYNDELKSYSNINLGLIKNVNKNESLGKLKVSITDNILAIENDASSRVRDALRDIRMVTAMEAMEVSDINLDAVDIEMDWKPNNKEYVKPLVITIPYDAYIPITRRNDPTKSIGGFVVVDEDGVFATKPRRISQFENLQRVGEQNLNREQSDINKQILTSAKNLGLNLAEASEYSRLAQDSYDLTDCYKEVIEAQIQEALSTVTNKDLVEVNAPKEVLEIMLARSLEGLETKLVYLADNLSSYMAYDYDEYGCGLSLVEKSKVVASFRIMLKLARIKASLNNATPNTKLSITLDEDDPEMYKSISDIIHEFAMSTSSGQPFAIFEMDRILNNLNEAAYSVEIDGGEVLPGIKTAISDESRSVVVPDTALDEELAKEHINFFYLAPELVNAALEGDFATAIDARSIQTNRQIAVKQRITMELWNSAIFKYLTLDYEFVKELKKIVGSTKRTVSIADIVRAININLPEPDSLSMDILTENVNKAKELYTLCAESMISEEMFSDILDGDNLTSTIDNIKNGLVAVMMRDFFASNDIATPLLNAFTSDDDRLFSSMTDHNKTTIRKLKQVIIDTIKVKLPADANITSTIDKLEAKIEADKAAEENNNEDDENAGTTQEGDAGVSDDTSDDDTDDTSDTTDDDSSEDDISDDTAEEDMPEEDDTSDMNEDDDLDVEV